MKNIINEVFKTDLELEIALEKTLGQEVELKHATEKGRFTELIFKTEDKQTIEVVTENISLYEGNKVINYFIQ